MNMDTYIKMKKMMKILGFKVNFSKFLIIDLKFDPKTFEFHFEYDITFTGEYEKGTLKVPEEYPKGTYKLKKGKGIFEVIHSEKNFYETIHNIFKELDKERLGESTLPTPQSTLNNHHQTWTDIYSVSENQNNFLANFPR